MVEYFEPFDASRIATTDYIREMTATQLALFFKEDVKVSYVNKVAIGRACNQMGCKARTLHGVSRYQLKQIKYPREQQASALASIYDKGVRIRPSSAFFE
jgi:hypothetical protein